MLRCSLAGRNPGFKNHLRNSCISMEPLEASASLWSNTTYTRKLESFAQAIHAKGAPLDCIAAIIDGTLQTNARSVRNQRLVYNGWKRFHCLKYHVLISPDGLIIHVYGPVAGRRQDQTVYKESGLAAILDKHFWTPDGHPLFIYGDQLTAFQHMSCVLLKGLS